MTSPPSYNATLVLEAIRQGHRYGFEIMRVSGLASGTVYPILRRLESDGLLESRWEEVDPAEEGRPRRRYYAVTGEGERALAAGLERVAAQHSLLGGALESRD